MRLGSTSGWPRLARVAEEAIGAGASATAAPARHFPLESSRSLSQARGIGHALRVATERLQGQP